MEHFHSILGEPDYDLLQDGGYDSNCTGGNQWIWHVFKQCIVSPLQYAGFVLGLISLFCWIAIFLPQIYENIKRGKMDEGVAFLFIFIWMLGDVTNLLGCILAKQLPFQLFIAIWYCSMDVLMISQFIFYYTRNKRRRLLEESINQQNVNNVASGSFQNSTGVYCIFCLCTVSLVSLLPWQHGGEDAYSSRGNAAGRSLLRSPVFQDTEDIVGYTFGIISSIFYLSARVPQILKNHRRQSVEGVSMWMFVMAILGNTTYGASILMQDTSKNYVLQHLPWLIGTLGTLGFDATLMYQFYRYGDQFCCCSSERNERGLEEERKPLLDGRTPVVEVW
ncbi:lysosomal amino acid transporter 1-like [Ptychodera flava]|uniref:lysosomal amino acid transporter 1-like n=1 Tax=Ptychodera flava TaxID=63121 RepID=UPI003969EA2B